MKSDEVQTIALLRAVIGYLGEKENFGWWQSEFFVKGSQAFLAPVFSRTQVLAQCNGVTQAAARVHDERIGVGYVYHLFRLPEDLEQAIHQALHDGEIGQKIQKATIDRDAALAELRTQAGSQPPPTAGPVRVGAVELVRSPQAWRTAMGYYLLGFEQEQAIFPYFRDIL